MLGRRIGIPLALVAAGVAAAPAAATTAGTNGQILWQRDSRQGPDLWAAAADGTSLRKLFGARGVHEGDGVWSPTNPSLVAFVRGSFSPPRLEVHTVDLSTGVVTKLTNHRRNTRDPAWSPDGARIAYSTDKDFRRPRRTRAAQPPSEIYVMNANGTGALRLTNDRRYSEDPDFSPDGTKIVFEESRIRRGVRQRRVAVVNSTGGGYRALTRYEEGGGRNPKWLPNGRGIVLEIARRKTRSDIAIINADGTGRRFIAASRAFETNPTPSPDGTKIAFTSDRDKRGRERLNRGFEVYVMNVSGGGLVRLTKNRSADLFPDWQRLP